MNGSAADLGKRLVLYLVTMILSLTVHEYSHAFVADKLGDDTPRSQGRLTLSPLAHYDIWGTFVIPIMAIVWGGIPFIGWARPVQTNPSRYTRRISARNGHRLVAMAGPLSNLFMAVASMATLTALVRSDPTIVVAHGLATSFAFLCQALVGVNLGLFVLNMIPLPPLDGSRLLPRSLDGFQQAIAPYSFIIILVLLNVRQLRTIFFWPVGMLGMVLEQMFGIDVGLA